MDQPDGEGPMKIHHGIYDLHLREWVVQPLELDNSQLIQARQVVARMNRAHDLLPADYQLSSTGGVRYKIAVKISP